LQFGQRPYRQAAWFYAEHRYRPGEAFFRLLATHLGWTDADRILDLGAGPAHVSLRLAPLVGEVVALEPEPAMLDEGRRRVRRAGGGDDTLRALLEWHIWFAVEHRELIVVQDRDWSSLPDDARERVRSLQRAYVELWVSSLRRVHRQLDEDHARTMAHAAFGLINSTPHSTFLDEPAMATLLEEMATGALGLA